MRFSLSFIVCLPDQAMELDKEIAEKKAEMAELKEDLKKLNEELKKTEDPAMKSDLMKLLTALRNDLTALRGELVAKENILQQQQQGGYVGCLFLGLNIGAATPSLPAHLPMSHYPHPP
jgi:septal ring factor EnvC (AmiA/AmiB activator)